MFVLLFWYPKNYAREDTICAVSLSEPETWLTPLIKNPNQKEINWLTKYNNPIYEPYLGAVGNLNKLVQTFPEKIKPHYSSIFKFGRDVPFNDEIPF